MKDRIVFFTKYTAKGPSSRYRTFQYLPYFQQHFNCIVKPLFNDRYIERLFQGRPYSIVNLVVAFVKRIYDVFSVRRSDLVYVEYELLPYFPGLPEKILRLRRVRFILDYDDAIFLHYSESSRQIIRRSLGNKIPNIIRSSSTVFTGSPYLTEFATRFSNAVIEIPTSIDYDLYTEIPDNETVFTIGWVGSKTTSVNIVAIKDALIIIKKKFPEIQISLMGFDESLQDQVKEFTPNFLQWTKDGEQKFLGEISVGIMPLESNEFNKGKCGFKLIQYMAAGKPTISSPLAANIKINQSGKNLHADTIEDWVNSIEKVISNRQTFKEIGRENIRIVRQHYSIQSNYIKYIEAFNQVLCAE